MKAENKEIFDRLCSAKEEIERSFGGPLDWQRLDEQQGCRIGTPITAGGWRDDPAKWHEIYASVVDAMIRLENALRTEIQKLRI